jgi:hypothetical protein
LSEIRKKRKKRKKKETELALAKTNHIEEYARR